MSDYLLIPPGRQKRLVHARGADRKLYWLRSYIADAIEDDDLMAQTPTVRWLASALEHLAAKTDWRLRDDPRRLGGILSMKTEDVRRGIEKLVELGRITRLSGAIALEDGSLQMRLSTDDYAGLEGLSTSERPSSGMRAVVERPSTEHRATDTDPMEESRLAGNPVNRQLPQSKSKSKNEDLERQQQDIVPSADAIENESSEVAHRLASVASKGDEASARIILAETRGLPDSAIARALESLLGRRPRPANPAGYAINALRSIRRELGLTEPARVDREPDV